MRGPGRTQVSNLSVRGCLLSLQCSAGVLPYRECTGVHAIVRKMTQSICSPLVLRALQRELNPTSRSQRFPSIGLYALSWAELRPQLSVLCCRVCQEPGKKGLGWKMARWGSKLCPSLQLKYYGSIFPMPSVCMLYTYIVYMLYTCMTTLKMHFGPSLKVATFPP